jgi:acyl-CoA dehydrogenase
MTRSRISLRDAGLGRARSGLFGTVEQKRDWLPKVASGEAIAAFAMTDRNADRMRRTCPRPRCATAMNGCWSARRPVSNGGIADFYVTFARTGEGEGAWPVVLHRAIRSVAVAERMVIAPHRLPLTYDNIRIPADAIISEPGENFRIGMETLNLFSDGQTAALGLARRARRAPAMQRNGGSGVR